MKIDSFKLLAVYSAVLTIAVAAFLLSGAAGQLRARGSFDTIDVKRINVREDDGTLRLIVSNTSRAPGIMIKGNERPHPSGNRGAGLIFYNNEGTETGGLIFGGKRGPDGKVSAGGHLSFDQHEQDQVIQLTHSEQDGERWAGMIVTDRPDKSISLEGVAAVERFGKLPDGPEKAALAKELETQFSGQRRLYVGKTSDRASTVKLSDAAGRARIVLKVTAEGAATIEFLDETGKAVKSLSPQS